MAYRIDNRRQCDKCHYGLMILKSHVNVTYWQCLTCGHKTFIVPAVLTKIDKDTNGAN